MLTARLTARLWLLTATLLLAPAGLARAQETVPTDPDAGDSVAQDEQFVMEQGPFGCTTTDVTIHDDRRGKDLELRVRTPVPRDGEAAPEGGWPLVVFSHGAGGSRDAFPELLEFWASHGYVSIAMTHSDSIELQRREGRLERGAGRRLNTPDGRRELLASVDLRSRVDDCSLVLDRLSAISTSVGEAGGRAFRIDPARMAIAGHSAGAFTSQLCAGVKARARGVGERGLTLMSVGDDRFSAAIIISGQGLKSLLLADSSWDSIEVPVFVITGSLDSSPPNMGRETPESRQDPFVLSRGVAKGGAPAYLLFIEGATHSSYAGKEANRLGERPTTDAALIGASVASGTTLFLDAFLKDDPAARTTLDADEPMRSSIPGKVTFEHK